jgi:KaiC/GvpD/RAD55 family RecA-like ATPase
MVEPLGIEKFDEILKGGFPEKSIILVEGTPGIGKDVLAYHFMHKGLKEGDACAYVFVGQTVEELSSEFEAYNLSAKGTCWINASGDKEAEAIENEIICDASEMFTISSAIKDFLQKNKKKQMRIVISVLSTLLMSNSPTEVYKHLSSLKNEFKKYKCTVLMLIETGMHDPQVVTSIEQLCDGVIDMKAFEKEWEIQPMLKIKKMRAIPVPLKYFKFAITSSGLTISD